MAHPTWQLPVSETLGSLVLMPCPGTKDTDLATSLNQLKDQGVKVIVTALSDDELAHKQVNQLGTETKKRGIQWFQLPIEDDSIPEDDFAAQWATISPQLQAVLAKQGHVALHCMGGSGRTGLLAAHLLLDMGWQLTDIKQQVQALRPNAFTKAEQIAYVDQLLD